jgi:hypothetical protein
MADNNAPIQNTPASNLPIQHPLTQDASDNTALDGDQSGGVPLDGMTPSGATPGMSQQTKAFILLFLVVDAFLCAVVSVIYLPSWWNGTYFPAAIPIAGLVNLYLVVIAHRTTGKLLWGVILIIVWGATYGLCDVGGPGGDVLLLNNQWSELLLTCGVAVPMSYQAAAFYIKISNLLRKKDVQ